MTIGRVVIVAAAAVAAACSQSSVTPSAMGSAGSSAVNENGLRLAATIQFGNQGTGSPFGPPGSHDHSFSAPDTLVPQTVVIDQGGTVTFRTYGGHGIAIYEPGVAPGDIDVTDLNPPVAGCPPQPLIDDATDRITVLGTQVCAGGSPTKQFTFTEPGKYLVICTFLPHFTDAKMYGWVIVRPRS
jgi:plastocyanin